MANVEYTHISSQSTYPWNLTEHWTQIGQSNSQVDYQLPDGSIILLGGGVGAPPAAEDAGDDLLPPTAPAAPADEPLLPPRAN